MVSSIKKTTYIHKFNTGPEVRGVCKVKVFASMLVDTSFPQHDHRFFYLLNPNHRLRVFVRREYVLAWCSIGDLRAKYLLPSCCICDLQHDHVLRKLNFDPWGGGYLLPYFCIRDCIKIEHRRVCTFLPLLKKHFSWPRS